jgi:pimeloyl-ACP methyl ester carboxylesterase
MEVQTSQSQDLASHGYVVVAIDHTYVSAATAFPDRIVTAREATTDFDTPEPAEPITQIMADDDKFVLEKLGEMNEGRIAPAFRGRLDLDKIGVIGHSVGGAVAYNMAINDGRVKAAVNLDGTVYGAPRHSRGIAPFLMLANDRYHARAISRRQNLMGGQEMLGVYGSKKAYGAAYNRAQRNIVGLAEVLRASGSLYTIRGSDHMKFTDIGLFVGNRWLRERMQIGGATDPARCLEITRSLTAAFFGQHLRGQNVKDPNVKGQTADTSASSDTLTPFAKRYPELENVDLN